MISLRKNEVETLRLQYPIGSTIVLDFMQGEQNPPAGTCGIVTGVDDIGQIHVNWSTGSTLALIPEVDMFHLLNID